MLQNKELKTKLRDIRQKVDDVNQIVLQNDDLCFELDNAKNRVEHLSSETERLKQKVLESKMKCVTLKSENDKLKEEIKRLKSDNAFNGTQNDFLSEQLNKVKKENEFLRSENERLKTYSPDAFQCILDDLNECRANNASLMCQIREADKEKCRALKLEQENDQLNETFRSMQCSIDNLKQRNKKLNNELETAKIEGDLSHSLRQQLSETRKNNDHLVSQLKQMKSSQNELEIAQCCLKSSGQKVESLKDENTRLTLALSKATSENIKLKSKKQQLKSKITQLTCEIQQLKNRNSNSVRLLTNLQTENDELKDSLNHSNNLLSQVFEEKKQRFCYDNDDISISDLSSESQSFDKNLPCVIQSISELKRSVNCVSNYALQSQLKKLTSKLEKIAKNALINS
ncbi:hypothetical protein M9Y10_014310 [Tritrichomonas musculus]|uniref:Uncharacterized protein n=1 Tax=Tritrichomonas musculus TaxID=1915356 RepID=A0ABR2KZR9_9EUKA